MTVQTPFFSAGLLMTAPDGTYGGIRKSMPVVAYDDRIELGSTKIYYQYLSDLRVYGNVLHVSYAAADGKQVEQFFKYNTFLARTGARELSVMADRVAAARANVVKASVWKPQSTAVQPAVKAEFLERTDTGWQGVAVYSALVAFPAICPVCARPAEALAPLRMSAGLNERGSWLVPICVSHESEFTRYLSVANWRANKSRLEFQIWNHDYAKQFLLVNTGEEPEQVRRQAEASPLLTAIKNGVRLVQFQYTVSALVVSLMLPSKVHILQRDQKPLLAGLKYSLVSAVAGWWSIAGLIWTPACIVRNCRGGIDLTKTAALILSGGAVSAGGYG